MQYEMDWDWQYRNALTRDLANREWCTFFRKHSIRANGCGDGGFSNCGRSMSVAWALAANIARLQAKNEL